MAVGRRIDEEAVSSGGGVMTAEAVSTEAMVEEM